jgi:hypothetical protein
MAILLPGKADTFRVAASVDSALDMTEEEYGLYTESLDESLLRIKEGQEVTWFVMRKVLPFGLAKKVQSDQSSYKNGRMQMDLGYITEEVRCSLVDIINPPSVSEDEQIKYKRESDGGTSELLMEQLIAAGIYMDLFRARATATKTQAVAAKKK